MSLLCHCGCEWQSNYSLKAKPAHALDDAACAKVFDYTAPAISLRHNSNIDGCQRLTGFTAEDFDELLSTVKADIAEKPRDATAWSTP